MIRWLPFLASLLFLSACKEKEDSERANIKREQARIADVITKIRPTKLILYSLDPNHDPRLFEGKLPEISDEVFHKFRILGRIELISPQEKSRLLAAFAKGIRESDGSAMRCFDPRHGIRVITEIATNDFVICFECLQVASYGLNSIPEFGTSSSPNSIFNSILDEYKIKRAE